MMIFEALFLGRCFCCFNAQLSNHFNKILLYHIIIIGYKQEINSFFDEIYSDQGWFQLHISIKINIFDPIVQLGHLGCSLGLSDRTTQTNLVGLAGMAIIWLGPE
ncbi:MAG: SH3 domain-containing protein [Planctomycetota bacterium]